MNDVSKALADRPSRVRCSGLWRMNGLFVTFSSTIEKFRSITREFEGRSPARS